MPRTCKACAHPEAHALNLQLVKREPFNRVALDYGVGREALKTHARECLPELLETAYVAQRQDRQSDLKLQASNLYEETEKLFDKCKTGKTANTASLNASLRAVKEIRGNIELLRRIRDTDELDVKLEKFFKLIEAEEHNRSR